MGTNSKSNNNKLFFSKNNSNSNNNKILELLCISDPILNLQIQSFNNQSYPQQIPLDWLVIVGSYQSVSIALIGVRAKQSGANPATPHTLATSNNSTSTPPPPPAQAPLISPGSLMAPPPNLVPNSPSSSLARGPPSSPSNGLIGRGASLLPTPNLSSNVSAHSFFHLGASESNVICRSKWR